MPLDVTDPATVEPAWARYVAGVVAQVRPTDGFEGAVRTTLPTGVGLSSSAALEVAVALAIGADDSDPVALARLCQAAEHAARGVPTGILDQIASICGVAGHALLARLPHRLGDAGCIAAAGRRRVGRARAHREP